AGGRIALLRRRGRQKPGREALRPHGPAWGTPLTALEDVLLEIRALLTEKMLDLTRAQQAAAADPSPQPYRHCPGCHQPLPGAALGREVPRAGGADRAGPRGGHGARPG